MITYSAVKGLAAWVFLAILGFTTPGLFAGDYNSLILEQIKKMPQGGRYSVSHFAKIRLQSSAHFESGKFFVVPAGAKFSSRGTVPGVNITNGGLLPPSGPPPHFGNLVKLLNSEPTPSAR